MPDKILRVIIAGDAAGALGAFTETEAGAGGMGEKLKMLGVALPAVFAAAGVGAAVGLYKIGESFQEQYNKIRAGTGAMGGDLDVLKQEFKNVVSDVPASFADAGTAVTTITQKLGISGDYARRLSDQFLELSRITKTDLSANLESGTSALNAWGVTTANQPQTMDELFRITQATGVSFADLTSQLAAAQPVASAAGLGFEETASLVGLLSANGLSASDVMPALGKALATAAKHGEDAGKLIGETFDKIKNAPTDVAAAGDALSVFGAKAGPKLAQLIREGKLGYDDFMQTILTGKDTIIGAGQDTQDFGEKWTLIKNRILVALEPIAMRVFDAIGKAMDRLGPYIQRFGVWFNQNLPLWIAAVQPAIQTFISGLESIANFVVGTLVPGLVTLGAWLIDHKPIIEGIAVAVGVLLVDAFIAWATSAAAAAASTIIAAAPVIALGVAIAALAAGIIWAYQNLGWFHTAVDTVAHILKDVLWPAFQTIISIVGTLIDAYLTPLRVAIGLIKDNWGTVWNAVASTLKAVYDHTIGPILDAISGAIDAVSGALDSLLGRTVHGSIAPGVSLQVGGASGSKGAPVKRLAAGGYLDPGWNIVGEAGAELLNRETGQVLNHSQASTLAAGAGGPITLVVPVMLDGREIARASARYTRDELLKMQKSGVNLGFN